MPAYDKLRTLAQRLSEKTRDNELDWEPTASSDVYQTTLGSYVVKISHVERHPEEGDLIVIEILNGEGTVIEKFDDEDMATMLGSQKQAWNFMEELYNTARRRALGTEQAIDSILEALDDDGIPF
jgi:hypothetical protein